MGYPTGYHRVLGLGPSRLYPVMEPEEGGRGRRKVPGCCREDKENILRGCNVNRAGVEPLFMESLSCQGICQGTDLRSYLDKGDRAGAGGSRAGVKVTGHPGAAGR